jgi:hypothetical protein
MSIEILNPGVKGTSCNMALSHTSGTPTGLVIKICDYCGWNIEEQDLEILHFFHSDCWKDYRKDGLLNPMPEDYW